MTIHIEQSPCWSTACFGSGGDATALELSALGTHLDHCKSMGPRLLAMRCGAEATQSFVTARFVTSLLMVTVLIAAITVLTS